MTTVPHDPDHDWAGGTSGGAAGGPEPPMVHTGLWRLPAGRRAVTRIRRAVRTTLRRWGLGPAAEPLARQVASLTKELTPQPDRTHGPIDLHLELRPAHRLLLVQLHNPRPDCPDPDGQASTDANGHHIIAITYGHRTTRYGPSTVYTHTFTWRLPTDHPTDDPDGH